MTEPTTSKPLCSLCFLILNKMQTNFNVPSPRPAESFSHTSRSNTSARSNPSTPATHARRPSIPISPVSNLPRPVPVPQRHGSSYGHSQRPSFGTIATDTPSPHLRRQARGSSSTGSSSLSGSILFGPASLPSSSFLGAAEVSVQRSRSDRRPSESRPEMHLRERVPENDGWLDITAEEILATRDDVQARLVSGAISTEEAVDVSEWREVALTLPDSDQEPTHLSLG